MKIPRAIFRAYDIRGILESQLTPALFDRIGQAFGAMMAAKEQSTVVVGYDGRLSGPSLTDGLIAGLLSSGRRVINIGQVPTPCLYHAVHKLGTSNGIMMTGSHNPPEYNGCKMILADQPLALQGVQELYTICAKDKIIKQGQTGQLEELNFLPQYIDDLVGKHRLSRDYHLVVDCGNGVPGASAPLVYRRLGAKVKELYCNVDGHFPNHHPDPGKPANMRDLQAQVIKEGADLGYAFDGDGDRLGLVTGEGKIIYPDRMMMLFARDLLQRQPGASIVFDVKCSALLPQFIQSQGGAPIMWKTGHSLIKRKMKESGALLGGEMSGHLFFAEHWSGADDALLAGVRLLHIIDAADKSIAELCAELPDALSTPEINLATSETEKFEIIAALAKTGNFGKSRLITIDGLRVEYEDGWGLVRASNTSPMLVLRFEAQNQPAMQRIQEIFRRELKKTAARLDVDF